MKLNPADIKRRGKYIALGQGRTATEGHRGLPILTIRENGRFITTYQGISLAFSNPLTDADKRYLATLGETK